MKKIILHIICFSLLFSSAFSVSANGILGDILEIDFGVEKFQIDNITPLQDIRFNDRSVQSTYDNFKIIDTALRNEFIAQYSSGNISYYQMQDLIIAYNNFIYYTQKTFEYVTDYEKNSRSTEIQNAIISGYSNIRSNYKKIQNILK